MGGWDYFTYYAQPSFFIEGIKDFLIRENKAAIQARKEIERKSKR